MSDHDWLRAREAGEAFDAPDDARAKYERLEALIATLPAATPSASWKQRVLASIDQPQIVERPARTLRRWVGSAALAAAAVVAIALFMRRGAPGSTEPTLATEIRAGSEQHRGDISIGDTLIVKAAASAPAELRIYGDSGEPLARCAERGTDCTVERNGDRRTFRVEVVLRARGSVRSVLFIGSTVPAPGPTLADDLAAAARDKTATLTATPIVVQ